MSKETNPSFRITKKREGGERGGGGLSESRAQSSFAKLKSKRHSSLDCRKLLFIKLHSTYSPAAPTKYVFASVYSTHHDEHLIKRTQTPETSETLDSTIRILIGALRFERRKTSTRKCSQKRTEYLRKNRCTDDKHDHRKARGQAIPNLPALAPWHPDFHTVPNGWTQRKQPLLLCLREDKTFEQLVNRCIRSHVCGEPRCKIR